MDPSHSVSNDPHNPPTFTAFTPFTNSYVAPSNPFFSGGVNPSAVAPPNNQFFQPPPPPQTAPVSPNPTLTHPPYSDMICSAIAALNEPDGSSKLAISRYIERNYTGIPPSHGALLTHHLKSLKNSDILIMEKKSYKFAASPPPTSVAVAAAAAASGLEPPRSDFPNNENQPDPVSSAPQTQKRGRGRPPKPKPDFESINVQSNGKSTMEQAELPVSKPEEEIQVPLQSPIRRPPGRPRKDGSSPTVKASVSGDSEIAKERGRPSSGRAAGRERKPAVVSAPASVFPYASNGGVRRRGRPRRIDIGSSSIVPPQPNAEVGGEEVAVVAKKRGRGRPPKIGGVIRKPLKPVYIRTGRPAGRPRKVKFPPIYDFSVII